MQDEADQVQYLGTGRRKLAVARVFLRPGSGKILINRRDMREYFPAGAAIRNPQERSVSTVPEQSEAFQFGLDLFFQEFFNHSSQSIALCVIFNT